jgi:hypothetical protein
LTDDRNLLVLSSRNLEIGWDGMGLVGGLDLHVYMIRAPRVPDPFIEGFVWETTRTSCVFLQFGQERNVCRFAGPAIVGHIFGRRGCSRSDASVHIG